MFADSCELIGVENTAFQEVQSPKEFDAVQREKGLRQICKRKIESPKTALVSDMMNGERGFEWKPLCIDKDRHQRRGPIVRVQDLQLRRQAPSQFQRRLTEENESRGVIFVRPAPLAVNSRAIEKFAASNKKQLHAACAPRLDVAGDVNFVADLHIDGYAGVLFLKRAILLNLTVER